MVAIWAHLFIAQHAFGIVVIPSDQYDLFPPSRLLRRLCVSICLSEAYNGGCVLQVVQFELVSQGSVDICLSISPRIGSTLLILKLLRDHDPKPFERAVLNNRKGVLTKEVHLFGLRALLMLVWLCVRTELPIHTTN